MGKNNIVGIRIAFAIGLMNMFPSFAQAQTTIPDMLVNGTLKEQMDYVQEKTRIYEDFRAIREDIFQKMKKNAVDSLNAAKNEISGLKNKTRILNLTIDSLNTSVGAISTDLEKMTKSRNSISFLGIEINKTAYNAVLWTIIAVLAGLLIGGLLAYQRNHKVTAQTKKEFEELKKEFEAYRKASREAREKMSMTHFNELKKLRGA